MPTNKEFKKLLRDLILNKKLKVFKAENNKLKIKQVHLYLDKTWTTVDSMLVREVKVGPGQYEYEAIAIEVKLSENSPFTPNQKVFLKKIKNGDVEFRLRSKKFEDLDSSMQIEQGALIRIKKYIKIRGDSNNLIKIEEIK